MLWLRYFCFSLSKLARTSARSTLALFWVGAWCITRERLPDSKCTFQPAPGSRCTAPPPPNGPNVLASWLLNPPEARAQDDRHLHAGHRLPACLASRLLLGRRVGGGCPQPLLAPLPTPGAKGANRGLLFPLTHRAPDPGGGSVTRSLGDFRPSPPSALHGGRTDLSHGLRQNNRDALGPRTPTCVRWLQVEMLRPAEFNLL